VLVVVAVLLLLLLTTTAVTAVVVIFLPVIFTPHRFVQKLICWRNIAAVCKK